MAGGRESTFSEFHDGAGSVTSSKLGAAELLVLEDLNKSGLSPKDIQARISNAAELTACGLRITHVSSSEAGSDPIGYTIPYYDHQGKPVPYYRIKVLRNGGDAKYRQPVGSPNRIYFPRDFLKAFLAQVDDDTDTAPIILLTEGEKKAAKAVKCGFPTAAVSGVDSWRNRTLMVPRESKISLQYGTNGTKGRLGIQIPSSDAQIEEFDLVAVGLSDVISLALQFSATIMIVFDEDVDGVPNPHVDRAAASLGYALREKGVAAAQLRLLRLKSDKITEGKLGLDDYLVAHSPANLTKLIHDCLDDPHALPTHPDPASFVARTLNTGTVTRKDAQRVALAVLTELDARGIRMWSPTHRLPHFFDNGSKRLFPIELMRHSGAPLHETPFGRYLYSKFRLSGGDHKPLNWLASQITGEGDLPEVNPLRVLTTVKVPEISPLPCIAIQVSDSYYILVSGNPNPLKGIQVCHNGQHGLMFVQDEVLPLDAKKVVQEALIQAQEPFKPYWPEVLKEVNFANKDGSGPFIASPLYYISPWFLRWSGMQLPIEVYTGEAGSGKSSLVSLRLLIMTGRAPLRNSPNDVRDWHSSIANVGGLHVVDNMHMTDKALRQRLSDEMARIVTEPHPHIEMRQLYTSSDILRLPISATFALTAIHTPFTNTDFQQRSVHFELERPLGPQVRPPDSEWVPKQLEKFGGRLKWLAHQIAFIHLFLKKVQNTSRWEELIQGAPMQNNYGSRLIYYGAAMQLAAEILGSPVLDVSKPLSSKGNGASSSSSSSSSSLAKEIQSHGEAMILETDHWMRALKQYVDMKRKKAQAEHKPTTIFTASQFFEWLCTLANSEIGHAPEDLAQTQRFLKRNRGLIARVLDLHEHASSTSNDIAFQLTT